MDSWFDEIITPDEQAEVLEGLREITVKLWVARMLILMLPTILDERFSGLCGI